ncbi:MAG: hypothetical protein ACYDB7_10380, partial [Mycobacteriales bacterium]
MSPDPLSRLNLAGAVPLDPRPPVDSPVSASAPGVAPGSGGVVVDVTEATFASEVVERSRQVPVVLDF